MDLNWPPASSEASSQQAQSEEGESGLTSNQTIAPHMLHLPAHPATPQGLYPASQHTDSPSLTSVAHQAFHLETLGSFLPPSSSVTQLDTAQSDSEAAVVSEQQQSTFPAGTQTVLRRPKHEKKYACQICDTMSASPSNLKAHVRERHTNEQPYACKFCADNSIHKAFARLASCTRHIKDAHAPRGEATDFVLEDTALTSESLEQLYAHAFTLPLRIAPGTSRSHTQSQTHGPAVADLTTVTHEARASTSRCYFCSLSFQTDNSRLLHAHMAHSIDWSPSCECQICSTIHTGESEASVASSAGQFSSGEWRWRPVLHEEPDIAAQHEQYAADLEE